MAQRGGPRAGRDVRRYPANWTLGAVIEFVQDYHINIFWSDEDGCYVADIPDLFACSAFGDSPEQALAELEQAKENWLAAARAAGKPIPEPRYRPPIYQQAR